MNIHLETAAVCLAKNQALSLTDARGSLISCHHGGLWITQDNDQRDIVLVPGESFTLDRDGPAVVSALFDSSVELLPALPPRPTSTAIQHRAKHAHATAAVLPILGRRAELFN